MVGVVFPILPSEITDMGTPFSCDVYDRQHIQVAAEGLAQSEQGLFRYKGMKFISLGATEVLWFLFLLGSPNRLALELIVKQLRTLTGATD